MAKKNEAAAAAQESSTTTVDNLDKTFENLKKGNLVSQTINEKALEEIAKSKEENQIRTAKVAIKEAEYNNLKTVLRLRNQRRLAKIDKKLATDTQELLFGLVGKKDEKGTFVPGTLTPVEYEKKRDELKEQANKDRKEADKVFQEEVKELQTKFPDYWCYDNSWDRQIYGTNGKPQIPKCRISNQSLLYAHEIL